MEPQSTIARAEKGIWSTLNGMAEGGGGFYWYSPIIEASFTQTGILDLIAYGAGTQDVSYRDLSEEEIAHLVRFTLRSVRELLGEAANGR